jgi:uncharacterized RDD family membrane protein YckC
MEQILDLPSTSQRNMVYAGFWIRLAAVLIDGFVLGIANMIILGALGVGLFNPDPNAFDFSLFFVAYGITIALNIAYYVFMESSVKQGTLGKMAVGIKVGKENGEKITALNALGRHFAKFLSYIIFLIGFIMAAFDSKKQALHDKLASTYVFYGN